MFKLILRVLAENLESGRITATEYFTSVVTLANIRNKTELNV